MAVVKVTAIHVHKKQKINTYISTELELVVLEVMIPITIWTDLFIK